MDYDTKINTTTVTKSHNTLHIEQFDWDYDFAKDWVYYPNSKDRDKILEERINQLKKIESGEVVSASDYGGYPRIWKKIIGFGMASIWPYWKPRPTIIVQSQFGADYIDWASLKDVSKIEVK